MKGRKPLPLEMHVLNGNPGKRALPDPVPVPKGRPECPPHFDLASHEDWEYACNMLAEMGVLSLADRFALELFCETWSKYREACRNAEKYGMVQCVDQNKRKFVINPYMRVRHKLWEQVYKMLGEFGFSPVARARLKTGDSKPDDEDPLVAMFKERAGRN